MKLLILNKTDISLENPETDPLSSILNNENMSEKEKFAVTRLFVLNGSQIFFFRHSFSYNFLQVINEEYLNGKLWNTKLFSLFPFEVQNKIYNFLVLTKILSKNLKKIFPKPLSQLIIRLFVDYYLKDKKSAIIQPKNSEKKRKKKFVF